MTHAMLVKLPFFILCNIGKQAFTFVYSFTRGLYISAWVDNLGNKAMEQTMCLQCHI